jgi:DNA segregation ATPase FtsK/SpoIIIE-like protein
MTGSNQKKETQSQNRGAVRDSGSSSSRSSKAAGGMGLQTIRNMEQRSSSSPSRQSARSQSASGKQAQRGKADQAAKKAASSRRPVGASTLPPPGNDPQDTKFIKWVQGKWNDLEPHHQQGVFGFLLLALSLLLFGSLTIFHSVPILSAINKFFVTFFGWSAYLLALGLVAFSLAHFIEGVRQQRFVRWSLAVGLCVIWLLLLLESRLILGHLAAGALAELLVWPFLGWPPAVGHIVICGLLILVIIRTFRLTFGHILIASRFIQRLLASPPGSSRPAFSNSGAGVSGLAQYLGQRPRFSRYMSNTAVAAAEEEETSSPIPRRSGRRRSNAVEVEEEDVAELLDDDDATAVDFEADFEEEDPLNDINVHRQKVGMVPKGARGVPEPLDLASHSQAVKGANQQALPFDAQNEHQDKLVLPSPVAMEPLAPNPRLLGGKKKARAAANPSPNLPNIQSSWNLPDISLLHSPDNAKLQMYSDDVSGLAKIIQETLRSFRVDAEVRPEDISIGPTVVRFGIRPTGKPAMMQDEKTGKMVPVRDGAGNIVYDVRTRVSRIMALQNDLALVLEARTIRMEAPVPGRPYVGVEIPNKNSRLVTMREIIESKEYQAAKAKSRLAVVLGRDVAGQVRVADLSRMPHLLIAGATGAGKSVMINAIIASMLMQATPDDVRLLMVDPKMVELNMYNGIPHLLSPVVIEVDKVVSLLKNGINEMERRYRLFSQLGVRNLDGYRKLRLEKISKGDTSLNNLPSIVIIIDELADLMMAAPEEVEGMICRLAQLARATGIHLVIATQRPSVDVITGLIKANIPTRISFMVSSAVDSRTIIDMGGAERLLGRGDMLYLPADAGRPERVQGAFLSDDEAAALADYWRQQAAARNRSSEPDDATQPAIEPGWEIKEMPSDDFELDDELLDKAEEIVREYGRASISLLQRRLRVGYSRAARLIDLLEEHGIIGQSERGGQGRRVLDSSSGYGEVDEGDSMADVAEEIAQEERERNEFLKQQEQAINRKRPSDGKHQDR